MSHTCPDKRKKDMGDSYGDHQHNQRNHEGHRDDSRGSFRGGRGTGGGRVAGGREGGGFRIRLSDNEMRAARSLQEAFNLRSTVAVLGFSIRTLAQMLEEGKLDQLKEQSRSEAGQGTLKRSGGGQGSRRNRNEGGMQNPGRGTRPDPFARPEKPQKNAVEEDLEPKDQETTDGDSEMTDHQLNESEDRSQNQQETEEITNPNTDNEKSSQESES